MNGEADTKLVVSGLRYQVFPDGSDSPPFGGESDDQIELFRAILEAPVHFPAYVKDVE